MTTKLTICIMLILATAVTGTTINLLTDDSIKIGINVNDLYYVATIKDQQLTKLELNSEEPVKYTITTTKTDLLTFAETYRSLNKLEKIVYINQKFDVPLSLIEEVLQK